MLSVLLRNPQFTRLWLAQVISQGGDWLNRIACLSIIATLGGSGLDVGIGLLYGLELALRLLPSAALGPLAGIVADRLPRRLVMVAADVSRAVIVLLFLLVDEPGELHVMYALIILQMAIGSFFDAARSAALPDTVRTQELHAAYALSSATWSVMLSVGALVGGVLVESVGTRSVFVIDSVTYLASAACLVGLKLPSHAVHFSSLAWREVLRMTDLRRGWAHARALGVTAAVWTKTFWGAAGGFLVVLSLAGPLWFADATARNAAHPEAFATGALYAARGVGTGLGPILARWFYGSSDRALRRQIAMGFAVAAFGYALFGFTRRLDLACLCIAIAHLGGSTLWVASTILWQKHVASEFRGRVFAIEFLGMNLAFTIGGLVGGCLYDATSSLAITAWGLSLLVLLLAWGWTRVARAGPDPAPERSLG